MSNKEQSGGITLTQAQLRVAERAKTLTGTTVRRLESEYHPGTVRPDANTTYGKLMVGTSISGGRTLHHDSRKQ